jgi:hypothetical protein
VTSRLQEGQQACIDRFRLRGRHRTCSAVKVCKSGVSSAAAEAGSTPATAAIAGASLIDSLIVPLGPGARVASQSTGIAAFVQKPSLLLGRGPTEDRVPMRKTPEAVDDVAMSLGMRQIKLPKTSIECDRALLVH